MSNQLGGGASRRLAKSAHGVEPPLNAQNAGLRDHVAHNRALIGRYFLDLRAALRLTPQLAALRLQAHPEIVAMLESGRLEYLPHWPETVRIVMRYGGLAGIDGRPALALISETLALMAHEQTAPPATLPPKALAPARSSPGAKLGAVMAAGARRLPQQALRNVRARPDRAFYALSLPLCVFVLAFNTSAMGGALTSVSDYFRAHFAEVREGLRWIDVSDPRQRRADKMQAGKVQDAKQ